MLGQLVESSLSSYNIWHDRWGQPWCLYTLFLFFKFIFSFILNVPCPTHPHFWQKCGSGQVFLLGMPDTSSSGGPPRLAEAPSCRVLCNSSVCVSSCCRCSDGRSLSSSSSSLASWDSSGTGVARFPSVLGTCVPMGMWEPSIKDGVSVSQYLLRINHFIKIFSFAVYQKSGSPRSSVRMIPSIEVMALTGQSTALIKCEYLG